MSQRSEGTLYLKDLLDHETKNTASMKLPGCGSHRLGAEAADNRPMEDYLK